MDEEAASTPHAPPPQGNPQTPPEFSIPPIPQTGFFPQITLEAFQAFTNYWYAQAQAQAIHGQYLVPPTVTFT